MVNNESTEKKLPDTKPKHRLYCEIDLNRLDKRTKAGQAIIAIGDRLRDFVGVDNPATDMLIQRILYKNLKLSMYETSMAFDDQFQEADHYLPMSNSLRLDLQALGELAKVKPTKQLTLKQIISEHEAAKK